MKRSKQDRKYVYRGLEPIMEDHSTVELITNRHVDEMVPFTDVYTWVIYKNIIIKVIQICWKTKLGTKSLVL